MLLSLVVDFFNDQSNNVHPAFAFGYCAVASLPSTDRFRAGFEIELWLHWPAAHSQSSPL